MTDLELLIEIKSTGSLSQAATRCQIAQPNASRSIARLERQLGLSLVIRSAHGSTLTDQGELVAQWADGLLTTHRRFRAAVDTLSTTHRDNLHILASQTIAECYAPEWLGTIHSRQPQMHVRMSVHNSDEIMEMVAAGDQRLGLVETPQIRTGLNARLIGYDQLVLIVAPGHPWLRSSSKTVSLSQLAHTPLVMREEGSGTRRTVEDALEPYGYSEPALEVSSNSGVLGSVIAKTAPALLSYRAVSSAVQAGVVKTVRVEDPEKLRRPLHAVWHRRTQILGSAIDLLQVISAIDLREDSR